MVKCYSPRHRKYIKNATFDIAYDKKKWRGFIIAALVFSIPQKAE